MLDNYKRHFNTLLIFFSFLGSLCTPSLETAVLKANALAFMPRLGIDGLLWFKLQDCPYHISKIPVSLPYHQFFSFISLSLSITAKHSGSGGEAPHSRCLKGKELCFHFWPQAPSLSKAPIPRQWQRFILNIKVPKETIKSVLT